MSSKNPVVDGLYAVVGIIAIPLAAVFFPLYWVYKIIIGFQNTESAQERKARDRTHKLYQETRALVSSVPDKIAFGTKIYERLPDHLPEALADPILFAILYIYDAENFDSDIPSPPLKCNSIEGARYRDFLSAYAAKVNNTHSTDIAIDTLTESITGFLNHVPPQPTEGNVLATVPLSDLIDPRSVILDLVTPFYSPEARDAGLFVSIRETFDRNLHRLSDIPYTPMNKNSDKLIMPPDYTEGNPSYAYLQDTPLLQILEAPLPIRIPKRVRFEHQWIVAGSGHGKTQTLQSMILDDLSDVAAGEASIIIIDSQGDLIHNISNLEMFAEGQPLADRLCLIDPTDVEWPVSLNLFDVGIDRINQYSLLDRERLINGILELYDFVLSSLLSAELTSKQSVVFRFITRLMLNIPNATIHTFAELLEEDGSKRFRQYIDQLPQTPRKFFHNEFDSSQFKRTRREIIGRLYRVLENQTFERMFSDPRNKVDMFREMNAGKVILVNTAKDLLKETGTEIFGRFFIAMIMQAAQERATIDKRLPTFLYIDECQDYVDENISIILEQARKFNVGIILSHQYLDQIPSRIQSSFAANTSIKFAGGVSAADARKLSSMMNTSPEFLLDKPKLSFGAYIRNMTDKAISLSFPLGRLEAQPTMTDTEREAMLTKIRDRYANHYRSVREALITPIYDPVPEDNDLDSTDTEPTPW